MGNAQGAGNRLTSNFKHSALTDHATTENHIVDWDGAKTIDNEPNIRIGQIKDAISIRKTETPMNRDEAITSCPTCTTASFVICPEEVDVKRSDENLYR